LAEIWGQVLNFEKVGVNMNFFEMGGDSVKAIQVVSRANKRGVPLNVQHLYRNQNIAELAKAAGKIQPVQPAETFINGTSPALSLEVDREDLNRRLPAGVEIEDILPLTPQQRHMLQCLDDFDHEGTGLYLIQKLYLPITTNLEIPLLKEALTKVTAHRQLLRSVFVWKGVKEPVQVICKQGEMPLTYKDWSRQSPGEQERNLKELLKEEWQQGQDRTKPTALRMCVIKLGETRFQFFFTSDYVRFDGWSSGIIQFEIVSCYNALAMGKDIGLIKEDHYKYYLAALQKQNLEAAEQYWRSIFAGYRPPVSTFTRVPLIQRFRCNKQGMGTGFARQHAYFSPQTTAEMDLFLQKHHLVHASLVYAVWAMLLSRYTGETDVVFGVIFSGRTIAASSGVESMVGNSINVLPVRIKINPGTTAINWLKQIFLELSQTNLYEYTPLAKIKEWCGIPHKQPMFDTYIVMQNLPAPDLEEAIDDEQYVQMLKGAGMGKSSKGVGEIPEHNKHYHLFFAQMEYPLRVDIYMPSQFCPVINYFRQYLTDSVMKGFMENMLTLVEALIKNPHQSIGELMSQIDPAKYPEPGNFDDVDFV
jgi:aryl carrier-like protein